MEYKLIHIVRKRLKVLLLPAILGVVLLVSVSFADKQHSQQICQQVEINIEDQDDYQFISEKDIMNIITDNRLKQVVGQPVTNLNIRDIEKKLEHNSFIKDAQVFMDIHGQMKVKLHQRVPVLRVINPLMQQYYIDVDGKRMPLSMEYAAYVPMATPSYFEVEGNRDSLMKVVDSSLFVVANYLKSDPFALSVTGQIVIEPDNEFTIIPRLGDFKIMLGDTSDLADKFLRLKSFYRTTLPQVGWNKYKMINLKYKNQIVANT